MSFLHHSLILLVLLCLLSPLRHRVPLRLPLLLLLVLLLLLEVVELLLLLLLRLEVLHRLLVSSLLSRGGASGRACWRGRCNLLEAERRPKHQPHHLLERLVRSRLDRAPRTRHRRLQHARWPRTRVLLLLERVQRALHCRVVCLQRGRRVLALAVCVVDELRLQTHVLCLDPRQCQR